MNGKIKKLVMDAMYLALSMIFSYVEAMLPINLGIPGVKLGLANSVSVIGLYSIGAWDTLLVGIARIIAMAMLFGNAVTIAYSLAGFLLSFLGMLLLRRLGLTRMAVSIGGGVLHNVGQLLTAVALLHSPQLMYYFPVLLAAGIVAGALIGLLAGLIHSRIKGILR